MKRKFDSRRFYLAIKKNKLIILLIIIASLCTGIVLNYKAKPDEYQACATVYSDIFGSYNRVSDKEYISPTYVDIIKSKNIAEKAKDLLDEEVDVIDIKNSISCSYKKDSPVYSIYATTTDPELSVKIADAVAKAFVIEMNTIKEESNTKVLDDAYEYEKVYDGTKEQIINIIISCLVGILMALVITVLITCYSNRIETVNDVTLNGEIEILGVIPNFDVE